MTRKISTALLSVCSNSVLIVLKTIAGLFSGSVSLVSEAIHSTMDLLASLIALFSVRGADLPPDQDHPYGHGKLENVSGVVEALLILGAAVWIVVEAIQKLMHPSRLDAAAIGLAVMFFSALVNIFVSRRLYRVAKREDSVALAADALHLKTDVFTSLGVGIALAAIWVASFFGLDLSIADPIIAMAVAVFISKEAIEMLQSAFTPLVDHALPPEELTIVETAVRTWRPEGFHALRTRRSGKFRHIDFHLTLPRNMTVEESHAICDHIEHEIEKALPNTNVLIHVEPEGMDQ